MSAGDINNPTRPRYEANERFDTQDADASSQGPRGCDTAERRSLLTTPFNVGGTSPTGLLIAGWKLTPNPTSGSDGRVRVGADAAVALDSDGNLIVKPAATTVDVTIPSGTFQVYAYFVETPTTSATRRFLPPSAPFTEFTNVIPTQYVGGVGFYTRAGDATSFVSQDVVNGATTALVALCVATNSAGAVTITGYNASTAPNGSAITNRVAAVQGDSTTIASGSNTQTLPQSTINVASTTTFPSSGTIFVNTDAGIQTVAYSGTSGGNQFTGCTGGTGVMSTGGAVSAGLFAPAPTPTSNGGVRSMHDLIQAVAFYLGQCAWNGSAALVPNASNNFGAFTPPAHGVQRVAEDIAAFLQPVAHEWSAQQTFDIAPIAPDYYTTTPIPQFLPALAGIVQSGIAHAPQYDGTTGAQKSWVFTNSSQPIQFFIPIPFYATISTIRAYLDKTSGSSQSISIALLQQTNTGTVINPGGDWFATTTGSGLITLSITPASPTIFGQTGAILIVYTNGVAGSVDSLYGVSYDLCRHP